jgi:putative Holliday junction resolvase
MRSGRRIAFDVGRARIGVAVSDFHAILATPIEHIVRSGDVDQALSAAIATITEHEAIEIYVGLPLNLKNLSTASTEDSIAFASALQSAQDVEVRLIDERLSTTAAAASLRAAGHSAKSQKSIIDSAAAAVILEHALATEKQSNRKPGVSVEEYSNED